MPDTLPKKWVETTLGEIRRNASSSISQNEMIGETFELYSVPAFSEGKPEIVLGDQIGSNKVSVGPGDVLLCKINPRINRAWVVGRSHEHRQIASTEWIVFSQQEGILSDYLRLFFTQDTFRNYLAANASGVGGSLMRVRPAVVEKYLIQLPPTDEQERIVAKLDALLSRVAAGEAAAHRALDRLQRYRAAVLYAAVTGELTAEWRKTHKPDESGPELLKRLLRERRRRWEEAEFVRLQAAGKPPKDNKWKKRYAEPISPTKINLPKLPKGWTWASPEQISDGTRHALAIGPFGSNLKVSDYRKTGIPLIFVRNIRSGDFSEGQAKFVSHKKGKELAAHQVVGGDLIITKMGDPPGDAVVYPEDAPLAIITADCIRLHVPATLNQTKHFFVHCINSRIGREQFQRITSGVAQQKVSLSRFAGIALPLPPLAEQLQVVSQVERRLAAADRLTTTVNRQVDRARATRQSLLREAFVGNLVPQSPNDEPASALLERIRNAREADVKKPKAKRMPKAKLKSVETVDQLELLIYKLGKQATPARLLLAAGLGDDVERFFDLLRAGRDKGTLVVPVGKGTAIKRAQHAN